MISVIIPTFNRGRKLLKAIESVIKQTYRDIEIIVVDDGSTDDTRMVINEISDSRIKYFYQSNQGACAARNFGILNARGEYIAFQDSDDEWRIDKLEKQLIALKKTNADIIFCRMERHDINGSHYIPATPVSHYVNYWELLENDSLVSTQLIMGKTECFRDMMFDIRMPRLQDRELIIRLSKKYKIYYLSDICVDVYIGEDSISKNAVAGVVAMERIIEKNSFELDNNPKIKAKVLSQLAGYVKSANMNPKNIYAESLKCYFDYKVFKKYLKSIIIKKGKTYEKKQW